MNVLFSRARWKLIVVGSFEFLDTVLTANKNRENADEFFLKHLLSNLAVEREGGNAAVVDFKVLTGDTAK